LDTRRGKPIPEKTEIEVIVMDPWSVVFRIFLKESTIHLLVEDCEDNNRQNGIENIEELIDKWFVENCPRHAIFKTEPKHRKNQQNIFEKIIENKIGVFSI